MILEVTYCE